MTDPNLIVGMERPDDAGVYRISSELALILTLDFITPVVDDPYLFGQIAVTNSLSDVYAMGGRPILAMNIICYPQGGEIPVLQEILRGGLDKLAEAGVLLVGGHSVDDDEVKFGISVTGTVHPDRVIRNTGARPGDKLILTKPLGTGIISTAIKAEMASPEAEAAIQRSMNTLNKIPAELMASFEVHACTDITGFGLLGHACEMIQGTDTGMTIHYAQVPVFGEALKYLGMGLIPGGTYRNEKFRLPLVDVKGGVEDDQLKILFDPQTSGGLLISVGGNEAEAFLERLHSSGVEEASIIGEITGDNPGRIVVSP
jgi:selenide, water dikinase